MKVWVYHKPNNQCNHSMHFREETKFSPSFTLKDYLTEINNSESETDAYISRSEDG